MTLFQASRHERYSNLNVLGILPGSVEIDYGAVPFDNVPGDD